MRIDWEMFLFSLMVILAAGFWTAGLALVCETQQDVWLLFWIPAALLTLLALSVK